ncbi:hypothetical protein Q3G72_023047 [Acer saccharum]|nr:hypothetical protein Q3G72_023047 [Acer saccharum]
MLQVVHERCIICCQNKLKAVHLHQQFKTSSGPVHQSTAGVGQPSYRIRSREASSSRVPQQSQVRSTHLVDEEASEEELEGEDEGELQEGIAGDNEFVFL